MVIKSKIDRFIGFSLLLVIIISLIIHKFVSKFPLWALLIVAVIYLLGVGFLFKSFIIDIDEKKVNLFSEWKFIHNYFSGIGYSILAGGIVTLISMPTRWFLSFIIISVGALSIIIGTYFLAKLEKTKNQIELGILKKLKNK